MGGVLSIRKPIITGNVINFEYEYNDKIYKRGISTGFDLNGWVGDFGFRNLVNFVAISDSVYMFQLEYFNTIKLEFGLTNEQKVFFEKSLFFGLAEFRYVNSIDIHKEVNIEPAEIIKKQHSIRNIQTNNALVLNGGGKDTSVAIELAKSRYKEIELFSSGPRAPHRNIAKLSGLNLLSTERIIGEDYVNDKKMRGHMPLSLYLAAISALVAYISGKHVVVSANESSANIPNMYIDGVAINHQYTKSFEFESDFSRILKSTGIPVTYFSIIRSLSELQVIELFSDMSQYHLAFRSCNKGLEDNKWCLDCPKCAFVIGGMFINNKEAAVKIWGEPQKVFTPKFNAHLIELINPIVRPFECVGTLEESLTIINRLKELGLVKFSPNLCHRFHLYIEGRVS